MSFDFGPGDLTSCINFAQKVWKRCRDAPGDFRGVATEIANLQLVLGEVQESMGGHDLVERRKKDLAQLIDGCNEVLRETQNLVRTHKDVDSRNKKAWNRLSWNLDPVESNRQRVVARIGLLTAFNVSIVSANQARVQKMLQRLLYEHQTGLREGSMISSVNLSLAEEGNEEAWFHVGRELEDVGITSVMIRDHRQYIIRWIRHALKIGKLNEGADLPGPDSQSRPPTVHEDEKCVAITEENLSIRTMSSQTHGAPDEPRRPTESTIVMSELSEDTIREPQQPTRPGDIPLSDNQSREYRCAHVYCERRHKRYSTWFDILFHARVDHSTGSTPWSKYRRSSPREGNVRHENLLCVNDSGRYLASSTPYANIPPDQDRDEMAFFLAHLYQAVRGGSILVEVPQLLYDLYYSTRCSFSDCRVISRNDHEHRQHFIKHFQVYEPQHDAEQPSDHCTISTSSETTHESDALARVHKRYAYPTEPPKPRNRNPFFRLNIFKRSKIDPPHSSSSSSTTTTFGTPLPYRTLFSGQTIESIVGAPASSATRVSLMLNNLKQPYPRPNRRPSYQDKRASRPTAFALIPDLRFASNDGRDGDGGFVTGAGDGCPVDSHALSEKMMAEGAEREGVLFIMASLRQTLGVSK